MNKKVIKRVLSYTAHYNIYIFISFVCAVISVISTLVVPILCGQAIDDMIGMQLVNYSHIFKIILYLFVLLLVTSVTKWIMALCNNKITYGVSQEFRNDLMDKIQTLPLSYLDQHPVGDIVSRMIVDVDSFTDGLLLGFTQLFSGILTIIGTLGFMLYVNLVVTLVVVVLTPLSLVVANFIAKHTYQFFSKQSTDRGNQTAYISEAIENIRIVQSLGNSEETIEQFESLNDVLEESSLKATFYSSLTNPSTRFVNNIIYASVALVGSLFAINGSVTIGEVSIFLSYASQYAKPFNDISQVVTELQNAIACAARVFEMLDEVEMVKEGSMVLEESGIVDMNHVDFSYTNKPLIEDLDLHISKGQKVAIVGPTGCGKTTLINLLMRFYDVNNGSIEVNHHNIKDVTRASLRNQYGMVLQDTWLKVGTIYENIAYGKKDATLEEVISAAKQSKAHSFIKRLPDGYNTILQENGDGLSVGQKQLLCITRLMLLEPSMLILDEATSNIDTRTELQIQAAFNKLMEGKTTFIVAHRLSTIKNADVILVMKDGKIIETGNHEILLSKKGFYYKLYNSQFENQLS